MPTAPTILIPAYQPDQALVDLIRAIRNQNTKIAIVVINDGSDSECQPFFKALEAFQVHLLEHPSNRGKGAALKTGFEYVLAKFRNTLGVVTADADGQHAPEDILKLVAALEREPLDLHLGCRQLKKEQTPLRSWIGNQLTAKVIRCLTQQPIQDTQTGLRAIPTQLLPAINQIESNGYALETEMLLLAKGRNIQIKQHTIQTIYIDANKSSHFNPLIDSIKIYWVFIRYLIVAMLSAVIDFAVFALANLLLHQVFYALILGRTCSATFNYLCNKQAVFRHHASHIKSAALYIALVLLNIYLAYHVIGGLIWLGLNLYLAKILADIMLFMTNFGIQRVFIFKKGQ